MGAKFLFFVLFKRAICGAFWALFENERGRVNKIETFWQKGLDAP